MKKLIFLDCDGVLHPLWKGLAHNTLDLQCVQNLNRIIKATGAEVVISSTWRLTNSLEELHDIFHAHGFKGKIIGTTPRMNQPGCVRGNEIHAWKIHNEGLLGCSITDHHQYVIIDDDSDFLLFQRDNFVQTDPGAGITDSIVDKCISILNAFMKITCTHDFLKALAFIDNPANVNSPHKADVLELMTNYEAKLTKDQRIALGRQIKWRRDGSPLLTVEEQGAIYNKAFGPYDISKVYDIDAVIAIHDKLIEQAECCGKHLMKFDERRVIKAKPGTINFEIYE